MVMKNKSGETQQICSALCSPTESISALTTTLANVPPILAIISIKVMPMAIAAGEIPFSFHGTLMAMGTKAKAPKPARKNMMHNSVILDVDIPTK